MFLIYTVALRSNLRLATIGDAIISVIRVIRDQNPMFLIYTVALRGNHRLATIGDAIISVIRVIRDQNPLSAFIPFFQLGQENA